MAWGIMGRKNLYMFSTDMIFKNIVHQQLAESKDVEPMHTEG
jgi:hypothetical protein